MTFRHFIREVFVTLALFVGGVVALTAITVSVRCMAEWLAGVTVT